MNNWWLKLYTIPTLKKVLRAGVISLALDITISHLIPSLGELSVLCYMYFVFKVATLSVKGLGENMNFHKTHMNFKDLSRDLVCEASVFSIGSMSVLMMMIIISSFFDGAFSSKSIVGSMFFDLPVTLGFSLVILFFAITSFRILPNWNERLKLSQENMHRGVTLYFLSLIFGGIFLVITTINFDIGPDSIIVMIALAVGIYHTMYVTLAHFHLINEEKWLKNFFKMTPVSAVLAFSVFFFFSFFSSVDINNPRSKTENRLLGFEVWSSFSPQINLETFKTLETVADGTTRKILYKKAKENIQNLHVEEILTKMNPSSVLGYIRYGNPTARDYSYIADHMVLNIDKWKKDPDAKYMVHLLTEKCKTCWVSDFDRQTITAMTDYQWPKKININIDKREIASEPKDSETTL